MKTRKIVKIDEDKCNGCGVCVPSCAEGAIRIIDGKARLIADNLCDGLGNCLGECPQDAITIEERPADEFDEQAVEAQKASDSRLQASGKEEAAASAGPQSVGAQIFGGGGCPGTRLRQLKPAADRDAPASTSGGCPGSRLRQLTPASPAAGAGHRPAGAGGPAPVSRLQQWPVQLALVPTAGPIWQDADVLIAADCVGFALPDFHERLLAGKTLVIACPKLDDVQPYVDKLTQIFAGNAIKSITVAHMEVPCCGGIVRAVQMALAASGRDDIRMIDITVGIDGTIQAVR